MKIQALDEKKRHYEEVLRRELTGWRGIRGAAFLGQGFRSGRRGFDFGTRRDNDELPPSLPAGT
jgi:hypothetical protein